MHKLTAGPVAFFYFLTLCVVTLDDFGKVHVGNYDLRFSYFTFAGLIFAFCWRLVFSESREKERFQDVVIRSLRAPWILAFLAMLLVGTLGAALNSLNPIRSWLFLGWSGATLILVPLVFGWVVRVMGQRAMIGLGILMTVLWIVLVHDLANCSLDLGWSYWGGMVPDEGVCRPRAWYQEPNYLSSFFLFGALGYAALAGTVPKSIAPFWVRGFFYCALAGAFFTTSRTGWLAVLGVVAIEFVFALRAHWKKTVLVTAALATAGAILVTSTSLFSFPLKSIAKITTDRSLHERILAGRAALLSWEHHPWIGTGPGASGALFVEHGASHPYRAYLDIHLPNDTAEFFRNDPLSKDLFTELLGEWGSLGTIFFWIGLILLIWPAVRAQANPADRTRLAMLASWVLFCVYATSQTLARFDLWMMLGVFAAQPQIRLESTASAPVQRGEEVLVHG